MTDLPEPMTPADCDLRGYDFMPLFGHRLFNSDFEARATDAEFRAAMRLWWMSWQQCPAGSLPDDENILCRLAGLGRDLRKWRKIAAMALHGFCKCADGRLYHPLISEEAKAAYARRVKERARKAKYRAGKESESDCPTGQDADGTRNKTRTERGQDAGRDADVPDDRTGQDRTGHTSSLRSEVRRGARLPKDWWPAMADLAFANQLGLDPKAVAEKFRDYWHAKPGKDGVKLDWSGTWRNWCRREAEQRRPGSQPRESKLGWLMDEMVGDCGLAPIPFDIEGRVA